MHRLSAGHGAALSRISASWVLRPPRTRRPRRRSAVDGGRAVDVLAHERAPVGARAQLAQDAEQQALHPAQQQRLRRQRLAAHLLEVRRARRARDLDVRAHVLGVQAAEAGDEEPRARARRSARASPAGSNIVGVRAGSRASSATSCTASASSAMTARASTRSSSRYCGAMRRMSPKSRKHTRPSAAEQVVARVRVAGDEALVGEQAPEEAVDDLAEAVALGLARAP